MAQSVQIKTKKQISDKSEVILRQHSFKMGEKIMIITHETVSGISQNLPQKVGSEQYAVLVNQFGNPHKQHKEICGK